MKDSLEEFVRRNRQAFDDREPPSRIWDRIATELGGMQVSAARAPKSRSLVLWRAAAVFFMAFSAWLLISREWSANENDLALREFADIEAFYSREIHQKVALIGEFQENAGLNELTNNFKQLEAMYLVLKEEMKTRPSREVSDALVLNLLIRIDLLNRQLERLEAEEKAPPPKRST